MELLPIINDYFYNFLAIFLVITAFYFSFITKFMQFRLFAYSWRLLLSSRNTGVKKNHHSTISSFQAFCIGLGARVGTGNLAGVAVAISMGGPGAIFWMWVIALLSMSSALIESTLAQLYKIKHENKDGHFIGGPAYYIHSGLRSKLFAAIFSISLIITFGFAFIALQSNTITSAFHYSFGINNYLMGLILVALTWVIIRGGIVYVSKVSEVLVPIMATFYIVLAIVIIIINYTQIPGLFLEIVGGAFGISAPIAGGVGYAMSMALINGARRGLYSNEAGMGSAPNVSATATPYPNHPAAQGLIQSLGVFFDTIIICTCTAFMIMLSGVYITGSSEGIVMTQSAMSNLVGYYAHIIITVLIFFFAFSSIIANYYYGETNILYLFKSKIALTCYRLLVLLFVYLGATAPLEEIWAFADITMGIMATINITSILLLSKVVMVVLRDFDAQLKSTKLPIFSIKKHTRLKEHVPGDVWE